MNLIKKIPIPISGLILAILSLGNLIQEFNPNLRYVCGLLGIAFIILLILKVIKYPEDIRNDFKNPVIASSSGTFSMAVMILSTYFIEFIPSFAYALWILGVALHILLIIYFTYHFIIHNFDINTFYPSYWITFVGITMGAITAHFYGLTEIGFIFFCFGFLTMLITLPIMIYRYIKYNDIPDGNKPLICIFTALFSILIVGYLNTTSTISIEFLEILYSFAIIFYLFSIYKFIEYRKLKFFPSFSAFTFPFVISATATKETLTVLKVNSMANNIATLEIVIATLLVSYILIRYLNFLKNSKIDN